MLVALSVTLCLCALAIAGTAKVVRIAMGRLGLDSMSVLLWFGLAEYPSESPAPRHRTRAAKTMREGSTRRRSPHRSLGRRAVRRRPAQQST